MLFSDRLDCGGSLRVHLLVLQWARASWSCCKLMLVSRGAVKEGRYRYGGGAPAPPPGAVRPRLQPGDKANPVCQ